VRYPAQGSEDSAGVERPAIPSGGRSVAHGFVYVASKLLPGVFGFVTTMVLTRLLSPADYGLYGLGFAITTLLSRAIFDWQGQTFVRFAQRPEGSARIARTGSVLFLLLVVASAIGYLGFWLSGAAASYAELGGVALVGAWAISWFEFSALRRVVAFKPLSYGAMNILRGVLAFAGASGAAWLTGEPLLVLCASFGGTLLAAWLYPDRRDRKRPLATASFPTAGDWQVLRAMLRFGLPIAIGMVFAGLTTTASRILLEALASREAVGLFTAGFFITQNTLALLASGLGTACYSLAVLAVERRDPTEVNRQLSLNLTLLLGLMIPAACGLALLSRNIAGVFAGPAFAPAVAELTPWLALTALFGAIRGNYLDHAFQLAQRTGRLITVMVVAAVLTIALDFLLIPYLGAVGAAMATALAYAISCIHAWISGRSVFKLPAPVAEIAKILAATAMMALVLHLVPDLTGPAGLAVQMLLGGVVYGTSLLVLDVGGLRGVARLWMGRSRSKFPRRQPTDQDPGN
jgi:O-antigen/teichoic acid export membrane protein